jgi:hypothetical protein
MLGCRALDQRPQVFAGEPTNLDVPTLGFIVELRPVGESCGRRVEEPLSRQRGAPWWTSALASAAITPPEYHRSSSLP